MILLHDIPFNTSDWSQWTTNQTANVISAIGAFLTLAAVGIALYQAFKNKNDVEILAKELREQNRLEKSNLKFVSQPDFRSEKPCVGRKDATFMSIQIMNSGPLAKIITFEYSPSSADFTTKVKTPYLLGKGEYFNIDFSAKDKSNPMDIVWEVKVHYTDFHGAKYILIVNGKGDTIEDRKLDIDE